MPSAKKRGKKPGRAAQAAQNLGAVESSAADDNTTPAASVAVVETVAANSNSAAVQAASASDEHSQLALAQQLGGMSLQLKRSDVDATHKFWDTQPVAKLGTAFEHGKEQQGPLDPIKTVAEVRKEPLVLPSGFEWTELDLDVDGQLEEVYNLLNGHYVEDDDAMFRFDYSREFIRWAVRPPGWRQDWIIGVRDGRSDAKRLVAFITAIPATIVTYGRSNQMVEINFLCVHQKLREKRLAPVLIKEITRRVNLVDIWQATFTAGKVLPRPVSRAQYFHRSLSPKKLVDVKFSHLARNMTMARMIKLYKLPEKHELPGLRQLTKADVPAACKLLNAYLERFFLKAHYSEAEFEHWFLPRDGIVYSWIISNPETKEVTDFVSFYSLPSSVLNHPQHKTLFAAYSYFNVATTVPLVDLVKDALTLAKQRDFDVFNCLDVMDNEQFIEPLKFGKGDGYLQYYLYNWHCPDMPSNRVGLVLL